MKDLSSLTHADLAGLGWDDWCERLEDVADEDGYCQPLGADHAALLIEKKPILLITFETFESVLTKGKPGHPLVWPLTEALGWSHMGLFSRGDTWFRDPYVIHYFDRLTDDGFFDDFDQVIFYGAGSAGYAAAAFSVATPGAKVLALQPQATLDPRVTEWDTRFQAQRRRDFTSRYGFAPDMLDAAAEARVIYDPRDPLDAMHASLFTGLNVTRTRARFLGPDLEASLLRMNVLYRILAQMSSGKLTDLSLARLLRARRTDRLYLKEMRVALEEAGRFGLMKTLCETVLREFELRAMRRALERANKALACRPSPDAQDTDGEA